MKKIKLLRVLNELTLAGLEVGVRNILLNSDKQRYENVVVCLSKKDSAYSLDRIKIYELNKSPGIGLNTSFKLSKIIKREKPDILLMHNTDPLHQGMLATLISDVPIKIYVDHNTFESKKSRGAILLSRLLSKRLDKIITVQADVKRKLVNELNINPKKIQVILNGTDTRKFDKKFNAIKIKNELYIGKNDKIITIVAGLRPVKDHITLIKAFSEVIKKYKTAKLLIVGTGNTEIIKKIKKEIIYNNIQDKVLMLGLREDIPQILSITDVSVLSSLTEGISQTIMESMAASKPIVATNVGGNVELVQDQINGFLVPPKDPESIAEAILKLLKDKKLSEKMGREGRKRVEEYFNITRVVNDYEQVYEGLLRQKGII